MRIVKNKKACIKYTSKPTCARWNKKLVAIHEKKTGLTVNKPIYAGLTALEISKWEMYIFHYKFIIKKFNTELLLTNTQEIHVKNL